MNSNIEPNTSQSPDKRIKSIQEFLMKAGFDINAISNSSDFIAIAKTPIRLKQFPNGLYVRIVFDYPLDQSTVQSIYQDAKEYSDYALTIIDQQPQISGWMAIAGLRLEEDRRFFFLPISESSIKESIALSKERQTFSFYIKKNLGKDFDPYDIRLPVSDAVSFFGRESLIDEIIKVLKQGQNLGLFGLQKMGKSSVLKRLQEILEFPVAYIYLNQNSSIESIYKHIMEAWLLDIQIKCPNLKWTIPEITERSDPKMTFGSAVKDLLMSLGTITNTPFLAIFLDEIDHIVPHQIGDKDILKLYIDLMDSMRGLQQETNSLSLLIAGIYPNVARRNYFWGNQKNPLYQAMSERFLLPLDTEDCQFMVRSLGQQINLTFDNEALDCIIQMSGAHPFLARQICSLAYKNRETTDTVSIQIAQKAVQDFVNNPSTASYFDDYGLWNELGSQDIWGEEISHTNHRILRSLADSSAGLTEHELFYIFNLKAVKQSINALRERGIIGFSNDSKRFYITFGLFHNWIRLNKLDME